MARSLHTVVMSLLVILLSLPVWAAQADNAAAGGTNIDQVFASQRHRKTLPPVVHERTEYYEIKGNRETDLQCELREKGCGWSDGKVYDSMTTWEFKWDYDYVRSPSSCSVDSFKVSVQIVFRYPKWMKDESAPQALIDKWDSYMRGLVTHETGHRDMAVAAASQLAGEVEMLPPFADCADLDRAIRKLCREHTKRLGRDAGTYDDVTAHGGSQGAVLE